MIDKSWCYSYWKGQKQNMNKETGKRATTEKVSHEMPKMWHWMEKKERDENKIEKK